LLLTTKLGGLGALFRSRAPGAAEFGFERLVFRVGGLLLLFQRVELVPGMRVALELIPAVLAERILWRSQDGPVAVLRPSHIEVENRATDDEQAGDRQCKKRAQHGKSLPKS
jgi:hypothetical protein